MDNASHTINNFLPKHWNSDFNSATKLFAGSNIAKSEFIHDTHQNELCWDDFKQKCVYMTVWWDAFAQNLTNGLSVTLSATLLPHLSWIEQREREIADCSQTSASCEVREVKGILSYLLTINFLPNNLLNVYQFWSYQEFNLVSFSRVFFTCFCVEVKFVTLSMNAKTHSSFKT